MCISITRVPHNMKSTTLKHLCRLFSILLIYFQTWKKQSLVLRFQQLSSVLSSRASWDSCQNVAKSWDLSHASFQICMNGFTVLVLVLGPLNPFPFNSHSITSKQSWSSCFISHSFSHWDCSKTARWDSNLRHTGKTSMRGQFIKPKNSKSLRTFFIHSRLSTPMNPKSRYKSHFIVLLAKKSPVLMVTCFLFCKQLGCFASPFRNQNKFPTFHFYTGSWRKCIEDGETLRPTLQAA